MSNASLQEILARYSDPSQNPYVQVRSQTPEPSSSQHVAQTLHPGFNVSLLGTPSANQWKARWKLDMTVFEKPLQVLDSRGCYIQFPASRTHSQSCVQQVLPEHANSVKSSCYTDENLGAVPTLAHDAAPVNHTRSVPDVPHMLSSQSYVSQRFWSKHQSDSEAIEETLSVPALTLDVQSSASGSHVDPIAIANESDASFMLDLYMPTMIDPTTEKEKRGTYEEKADSRREAGNREAEKLEIERMEIQEMELTTREAETREIERIEIEKPEIESQESTVANEAGTKKEPRVSPATNTSKLLRIERKLNKKDLFMGWYKSRGSSELRYPRECIAPKIGDVYVHSCKKEGIPKFQLWVRQINRGMTIWVKAHIFHIHPKLLDRRLTLATTGEPYWSTRLSLSASGSRERAGKIADMILY
ncbi:uncharacterized protein F5147DRAFT_692905 [Suillus discolor]|uniref:Uncharacterized protein n=1 Tax=Suillus discolor TaxID=1912936 RepID=A0A9P7JUN0_9AGAM|nr:uncharacterized protein F5147DRAFT_692905 [Suillus discolor]KAG2109343.1 hypothetical protein F5147DRAFT_692905 [Suillus discolor]